LTIAILIVLILQIIPISFYVSDYHW